MSSGFLTPKAIANRIKAKGLQRLRWYCQMCNKQCRDENGFKCHCSSEAHLRQMELFSERPDTFIDQFSEAFCQGYIDVLKRKGGRKVKANAVYTEYISDRHHVHMNSTKWDTLSSFVAYLGKSGLAVVDETREGEGIPVLWVKYIDRDPRVIARQQELNKAATKSRSQDIQERQRIEQERQAAEERHRQIKQQQQATTEEQREADTHSTSQSITTPITVNLQIHTRKPIVKANNALLLPPLSLPAVSSLPVPHVQTETKKVYAVEQIIVEDQQRKKQRIQESTSSSLSWSSPISSQPQERPPWLSPGLIVKVLNRVLSGGIYYKQKGCVLSVSAANHFAGQVEMLDPTLPPIQIDQSELETVIPALHQAVRFVAGDHRGERGTLLAINQESDLATADVMLDKEHTTLTGVSLEAICKVKQ